MPKADIYDHMVWDGLWDIFNDYHMGVTAENVAEEYGITREDSDAYAVRSHQRAARLTKKSSSTARSSPSRSSRRRRPSSSPRTSTSARTRAWKACRS